MKFSILVALLLLVVGCLSQDNFQRVSLNTLNPNAVCNDGSSATYFFRPGSGSGSSIWTIYLEGGGFCYDQISCEWRWNTTRHFMTSDLLPEILNDTTISPDVNHGGINSGDPKVNPHFYNANQVYLWYCSSDTHAGNSTPIFNEWVFRGRVIVETLIQHLIKVQSPSMTQASQILLLGFSAGGMGTFNNADFVGDLVAQFVPNAEYKVYVDSGWLLDIPYLQTSSISSREQFVRAYHNFDLQLDASCVEVFERTSMQHRCIFANDVLPHITSDLFVAGYQFDMPFLQGASPPFTNASWEYATILQNTFLLQSGPLPYFFSPNCWCHGVVAYDTRWNEIVVNGQTASDSVWAWFSGNAGASSREIDQCSGFQCNPTCSCVWN